MASDDLEARKTSLEDRIDALGSWMIRFTWPVAVGLLMEFYAILEFATTQKWNASIDHMGLLLVTAGVAGELAVEQMSHTTERKLRRVNKEIDREADERIADLNLLVEQERLVGRR